MKKIIFVFSALSICILALFQISKYSFISSYTSIEFIIALVAVIFLFIGLYLNRKNKNVKKLQSEEIDWKTVKKLGISNREYEVLVEISKGYSNKEIGEHLFVSESTIKTHVSNLLVKLEAKRRTEALRRAKELHIIVG
ncbi:response regulator transcription factor [Croceivirga lutea]|uniref:response regulator transcription factor n=1 Tax=Croceivirga lutea TaxID=1775167 RepID=UPI00163954BC|nr:response regulator transcription factor [Croceivirga lutea]